MLTQTPPMLLYSMKCSINDSDWVLFVVKGQVNTISGVYWLLDNSRIRQLVDCQLADWTSRGLVNSQTRQ